MLNMAGRPKTRARERAQQRATAGTPTPSPTPAAPVATTTPAPAPEIPEAVAGGAAHAHDARPRTRAGTRTREGYPTPPRAPSPARSPGPGPKIRNAVDTAQERSIDALASKLRPGVTLRLERAQPTWCAGWLEDYPVQDEEALGELYQHLATEWGGQTYKVTVLGAGDTVLYQTRIAIAGRPRQAGRFINRDEWEGRSDERARAAAATASSSSSSVAGGFDMVAQFVQLFMQQQQRTQELQLESVRDMVQRQTDTTTHLLTAVVNAQQQPPARATFVEQLGEVVEATNAIERVRKSFGAARTSQRARDDGSHKGALHEAMTGFLTQALGATLAPKGAALAGPKPPPRTPVQPLQQPLRVVRAQPETSTIPEAIPGSGQ
jgi:hypothetical protein